MCNKAYVLLSLAALFWSGNFVVGRALAGTVDPLTLNFWRWVFALALLVPMSFRGLTASRSILLEHWRLVLLLGASGIALFHILVYAAVTYTTAVNTLLLVAAAPVAIVVCSWILFRDPVRPLQALGIAISLGGALLLVSKGDLGALGRLGFGAGEILAAAAVLVWGAYSSLLKRRPGGLDAIVLLTATVGAGVLLMLPFYVLLGSTFPVEASTAAGLAYIVVFASVLGFVFWSRGVASVGPNTAGVFLHLMPAFGAALSVGFLGEEIASFHIVGAALVLLGVLVASPPPPPRRGPPSEAGITPAIRSPGRERSG